MMMLAVVGVGVTSLAAPAYAESVPEMLKARDAEIRAVLPPAGQQVSDAQKLKAEELLIKIVDFQGMAQTSLDKTWSTLNEKQRRAFLDAFSKRFKAASAEQIDFFRSNELKYSPEQKEGEFTKVSTNVTVNGDPSTITYVLKSAKDGWLIEDIVIDDVSTVDTYKHSFAKIVNKDGIEALIAKLNKAPDAHEAHPTAATASTASNGK
jgi:phospholipid transport system substrate-binding protein